MSFYFKTQRPFTIEIDNSGVIFENRKTPRFVELFGYFHNGVLDQVVYNIAVETYFALECLVHAVLGPGLGKCFHFGVGGIAP